jgi:heme A synthase
MRFRTRWLIVLIIAIASGALITRMESGFGCGPFFPTAYFT